MGASQNQKEGWEREYRSSKMLSPSNVPHGDVVRFMRWLKKECKKAGEPLDMDGLRVLDLGSGTGRNSFYMANHGANVTGYEFSETALAMARKTAAHGDQVIEYKNQNIGAAFQLPSQTVDIVLDVMSSNSLNEAEREIYLSEISRVLKPGGYLFLRALSLDGDVHAKELIKRFPGTDSDTYVHPDLGITEKTFTKKSLTDAYGPYFTIISLERLEHYNTVAGRKYKRSYWVAYMQKAPEASIEKVAEMP
ncbi:MAG: SmtA2, SAM-dependent methyltransferase [Parcubacteria group bacterium]|nr:SmtA2, SAM-dependent methyltransferase [Parcubacteria group bacterium]